MRVSYYSLLETTRSSSTDTYTPQTPEGLLSLIETNGEITQTAVPNNSLHSLLSGSMGRKWEPGGMACWNQWLRWRGSRGFPTVAGGYWERAGQDMKRAPSDCRALTDISCCIFFVQVPLLTVTFFSNGHRLRNENMVAKRRISNQFLTELLFMKPQCDLAGVVMRKFSFYRVFHWEPVVFLREHNNQQGVTIVSPVVPF